MIRFIVVVLILVSCGHSALARKFDFKDENVSSYFHGFAGMSTLDKKPYESSSGGGTRFDKGASLNLGGEFGFAFGFGPLAIRLGAQVVQPQIPRVEGSNATGTKLFDLDSSVISLVPKITFEITLSKSTSDRSYLFLAGGLASVKVEQEYQFTAAGTTAFNKPDYKERIVKSQPTFYGGIGYEFLMVDNVTMFFDLGYHYLQVSSLKHNKAVDRIDGPVAVDDIWNKSDGSPVNLDLGGPFVGVGFRFYIDI